MKNQRLLLEGAALIDGTGGPVIENSTVLIEGNRITYAGPRTARFDDVPAVRRLLVGKTLIPGLIEAHTHASFDADMLAYVKNGITTIRFAGLDQAEVVKLRGRIEGGELIGPRILSCGPMIDQPPLAYPEWSVAVETAAAAASTAERLIVDDEVEFLILTQRVTAPVMRAVVEAAHARGRPVVAQTWALDGQEAADLGIDELHNSSRVCVSKAYPKDRLLDYSSIPERLALSGRAWATIDWAETLRLMEAMVRRSVPYCGMRVISQFQAGEGVAELEADADFVGLFGAAERASFGKFTERLRATCTADDLACWRRANDSRLEWMRRYRAMGGTLLIGTDMQFGGIMLHREIGNIAALGASPLEVITMASGDCARALRWEARLGTIGEGKLADIVVLNRDPLVDLGGLRDIDSVIKDGVVLWSDPHARKGAPT